MTTQIHIDTSDVEELAVALQAVPEIVAEEMTAAVWEAELLLQRETQELTPVGVGGGGGLKGSIAAREPVVLADTIVGAVGTSLAYAVPVEMGTKPHFPPIAPLRDWAEHVLGVSGDEALSVAWAVARKIARKGTEGAHMFERAFETNRAQVERIFEAAHGRITERMGRLH
jgi:hypothetical protein